LIWLHAYRFDSDAKHGLPLGHDGRDGIDSPLIAVVVFQRESRKLTNVAIPFFLQALLEQLYCHCLVTCRASYSTWSHQLRVVTRYAIGHNMVAGSHIGTDNASDDQILINGEIKGLTNMDIVKRLNQIIQFDKSTT